MSTAVSQKVDAWVLRLDRFLHEKNVVGTSMSFIENKTGVRRLYLSLGVIVFVALNLLLGYGAQFLCNFVGFLYPAYASVKAIESHKPEDDTKWLTYWVVYSAFALVEFFADICLFWIPFYWFLKCCFLIWCMLPSVCNGSFIIYYGIIRPLVLKYQDSMDKAFDNVADAVHEVTGNLVRKIKGDNLVLTSGVAAAAISAVAEHIDDVTDSGIRHRSTTPAIEATTEVD